MMDLDSRLSRGPLRVRSIWSPAGEAHALRERRQRRRFLFVFNLAAVCAAAIIFTVFGRGYAPGPHAPIAQAPMTVPFADGSLAELSSRDAELHIDKDSPTSVVAHLKGGARFQVVPNHERTFEVRAGDVRVRVLGTIFSVQELPAGQTQVLVERGRVEVAWLGGSTFLEKGQGGSFPPAPLPDDVHAAPAETIDPAPPPLHVEPSPRARSSSEWRDEARAGNFGRAYESLHAKGRDPVHDEADDLMLAADVARLSAHADEAVKPLRDVIERHPTDKRAPVAAFTLGRVLLDDLGRPSEAAIAFEKARSLWPTGPLSEDALARAAEAWEKAGRTDAAHAAATEYAAQYPHGRHAASMQKILAR